MSATRRPWIKFCGITSPADARAAIDAGADLLGLNFHPESPRAVSFGLAAKIVDVVRTTRRPRGPNRPVRTVAVFVNPEDDLVEGVLEHVRPDILQFHGDESPTFCRSFRKPFLKAFRLRSKADADKIPPYLGGYSVGYLIDAWDPTAHGGTGRRIHIETARHALKHPKGFLAGGLRPQNVQELVETLRPFGVDVASGIESRPGIKSADQMMAFVRAVEAACRP